MAYEILEHTSDLKIRALGRKKEEMFFNMMLGMIKNMEPETKEPEEKIERTIRIKSLDFKALLVDFLSEILYLVQINKEIYDNIEFTKLSEKELEGKLIGRKVERFGEDIKAVTHHGLEINNTREGNWEAIVLFDL